MAIRHLVRFLRALLRPAPLLGLAIIAIFWVALAQLLQVERDKAVENAIQRGASLAQLFEQNTIRLLRSVDQSLLLLRLAYEESPKSFDLRRWAERTSFINEVTIQSAIIGPDGNMEATTAESAGGPVDLSDREHFRAHVNAKSDELFISKPVKGRASGKMSIQLTRKLRKPDGSFGGVIVASIDPAFVERFYRSINLGAQEGITLRGLDGVIRASHGIVVSSAGEERIPAPLANALAKAPEGHFWGGAIVDGRRRLISYRLVAGYPLVITLAIDEREIFAAYERHKLIYTATAAILTLLVLLGLGTIVRRQASLEQTNLRFSSALENMTHGLSMFDGDKRLVVSNKRYADMYSLPPELVKIGTPYATIVAHRVANRIFADEKDAKPLIRRRDQPRQAVRQRSSGSHRSTSRWKQRVGSPFTRTSPSAFRSRSNATRCFCMKIADRRSRAPYRRSACRSRKCLEPSAAMRTW